MTVLTMCDSCTLHGAGDLRGVNDIWLLALEDTVRLLFNGVSSFLPQLTNMRDKHYTANRSPYSHPAQKSTLPMQWVPTACSEA
jgi:hypothetical protein